MEYIFLIIFVVVIVVSIASSMATAKKADTSTTQSAPKKKAKATGSKSVAKPKGYQPMTSHLNTDYSSRLTDLGQGDSTYDTVADIGSEQEQSTSSATSSLVDFGILYGDDDGNMDVSGIATAIVLGEVLGAPKGKR